MKRCMLDLETLDTKTTAVVLSLGAVIFDETGLYETCHYKLEIDDQIRRGRTVSGATVDWWMNQSEEARTALFSPAAQENRIAVGKALLAFGFFIKNNGVEEVWGNGADFDNLILGSLHDTFGMIKPWSYGRNRCYRTLKNLVHEVRLPREGTHHDALDDAIYQAKNAIAMLGILKQKRSV